MHIRQCLLLGPGKGRGGATQVKRMIHRQLRRQALHQRAPHGQLQDRVLVVAARGATEVLADLLLVCYRLNARAP